MEVAALTAGESRTVDVPMALAGIREWVVVSAETPRDSLEAAAIRESPPVTWERRSARPRASSSCARGGSRATWSCAVCSAATSTCWSTASACTAPAPTAWIPPRSTSTSRRSTASTSAKGPFDLRHAGGLGGLVNVVTRRPERGLHATPSLSAGSFGYWNPSLAGSWAGEQLSALAGYSVSPVRSLPRRLRQAGHRARQLPEGGGGPRRLPRGDRLGRPRLAARREPPAASRLDTPVGGRRALSVPDDGRRLRRHRSRQPRLRDDRHGDASGPSRPRPTTRASITG